MEAGELSQYKNHVLHAAYSTMSNERMDLLKTISADAFYSISVWPRWAERLFWKKPLGDTDTFKIFLFPIGNGCAPYLVFKWILSSQFWASERKTVEKRANQLNYLLQHMDEKGHEWFYYDLHHNRVLYLNGNEKQDSK